MPFYERARSLERFWMFRISEAVFEFNIINTEAYMDNPRSPSVGCTGYLGWFFDAN